MPRDFYTDRIYEDIRAAIIKGQLKPGDKIETMAELKARYACSETPVKAALRRLQDAGYIESHQGVGNFVTDHPS